MPRKTLQEKAREIAYRSLARRPRSQVELTAYLKNKQIPEETVREVIEYLAGLGYIDDRKFAAGWTRRLVERGMSRYAIRFELRKKGVADYDIDAAFGDVFAEGAEDDKAVALRIAKKKAATLMGVEGETARRRLSDYLRRRGFGFDVIRKALCSLNR